MSQIPTPPPPPQSTPRYTGGPVPGQMPMNFAPIANNWGWIRLIALWLLYFINIVCGIYCCFKYLFLDLTRLGGNAYAALQQAQSLSSLIFVSSFVIWLDIIVALLVYITKRTGIKPWQMPQ